MKRLKFWIPHIEWGRVPLTLGNTLAQTKFYGIVIGRIRVGVLRQYKNMFGERLY